MKGITAAVTSRGQDSRRGIILMILAMFLFAGMDAQSKFLSQHLPVLQIAWARHFGFFVAVAVVFLPRHGLALLRTRRLALQILRGTLVLASSVLFIVAISFVPLADAVAVSFVAPLVVTALGAAVLGEAAGLHRWLAVIVGFGGAMIVVRPGFGVLHPAAFLVLGAGSLFGAYQILARLLSDTDDARTTLCHTAIVGAALLTPVVPFVWEWPTAPLHTLMLIGLGLWAAAAEFAVIKAFVAAPAAVVAPFQYTMLIWSTIYGFVLFYDLPDAFTLVGAAILIATGLYTYHREDVRRRA